MEQPSKRMKLEPSMDERSSKISSLVGERCKRSSSLQLQPEQSSIPKSFESLPVELIYAICHYLSCMEKMVLKRVSRRCYFVLSDPVFWETVSIDPAESKNIKYVKAVLKLSLSSVHTMCVHGYLPPNVSDISFLVRCSLLTRLDICGSRFSVLALNRLVSNLPNLSRFATGMPRGRKDIEETLPLLSSLTQLVLFVCELNEAYEFCGFWESKKCDYNPRNVALVLVKGFYSYEEFEPCFSFAPVSDNRRVLSTYVCEADTFGPNFNFDSQRIVASVSVPAGSSDSCCLDVSTAVSSSVLTSNHLYDIAVHSYMDASNVPCINTCKGSSVTYLNLSMCELSTGLVECILKQTPNLIAFDMNGATSDDPKSMYNHHLDELFRIISIYSKKIVTVSSLVEGWHVDDPEETWQSISSLSHLEHLSVCSCMFIPRIPYSTFWWEKSRMLRLKTRSLMGKLKGISPSFQSLFVNAYYRHSRSIQSIISIISTFENLKCFHIRYAHSVHSISFREILTKCQKLEDLGIIDPAAMKINLKSLAVSKIKHLKLIRVNVLGSFFKSLVPENSQNIFLQTLVFEGNVIPTNEISLLLTECPNITFCHISLYGNLGRKQADHGRCEELKQLAKNLKIPIFKLVHNDLGKYEVVYTKDLYNYTYMLRKL